MRTHYKEQTIDTAMRTNSISKKLQALLKDATPKQKAILVCLDGTDARTNRKEALVTEEEAAAIKEGLKTDKERREYNKWLNFYNVYARIAPLFGLAKAEYERTANDVLRYLQQWEILQQEETHLNTILDELKDSKPDAVPAFEAALSYCSFKFVKVERDSEGYVSFDVENLYGIIKEKMKLVYFTYSAYKTLIIAVEDWTKKRRCKDIMPGIIKESIAEAKEDYALQIAPAYSRKLLKERHDRGERISISEQKKALYPYYEEIGTDDEFYKLWADKLKYFESL